MMMILVGSTCTVAYAYEKPTREQIFGVTQDVLNTVDDEELKRLEDMYYELSTDVENQSAAENGIQLASNEHSMERSGLELAIANSFKGSIWITKDGDTLNVNHGHAALVYTVASWDRSTIEHRGPGSMNPSAWRTTYSDIYNLEGDAYWQSVKTLKIYDVSATDNGPVDQINMVCAADYAVANLLGYEYAPLALKVSTSTVNCATLVYKAYAQQKYDDKNIILGNPLSATVIPKDLVEDKKLRLRYSFQWPGEHKWDID